MNPLMARANNQYSESVTTQGSVDTTEMEGTPPAESVTNKSAAQRQAPTHPIPSSRSTTLDETHFIAQDRFSQPFPSPRGTAGPSRRFSHRDSQGGREYHDSRMNPAKSSESEVSEVESRIRTGEFHGFPSNWPSSDARGGPGRRGAGVGRVDGPRLLHPPAGGQMGHTTADDAESIQTERGGEGGPNNRPGDGDEPIEDDAAENNDPDFKNIDLGVQLTSIEIASLIVNKMIGTGIFTAPPMVLMLTQQKGEALALWVIGLLYTYLNMVVYLEYARKLPYNGGEMVYLDAVFPSPRGFSYTMYAFFFVTMVTTSTNCLQFADQIFLADTRSRDIDLRLARFFAVVILTTVCLTLYFSNRLGRASNLFLATYKIVMLLCLLVAVCDKARRQEEKQLGTINFRKVRAVDHAVAFFHVLWAYSGWENATFVTGEIAHYRDLRKGFWLGIITVGFFYLFINLGFLLAIGTATEPKMHMQYAPWIFNNTVPAQTAWAVLTCISALGNIIAVTYTSSRVRQGIAASNILPWSRLWVKESPFHPPTPAGGLIMHWISGVFWIALSAKIKNVEAATFPSFVQVYTQRIFEIFVSWGFIFVQRRVKPPNIRGWNGTDADMGLLVQHQWSRGVIAVILVLFNIFIVIAPFIRFANSASTDADSHVAEYVYPSIAFGLFFTSLIYSFACFYDPQRSIIRLAGYSVEIRGLCNGKNHLKFGYKNRVILRSEINKNWFQRFLTWVFGGKIVPQENIDPVHDGTGGCTCGMGDAAPIATSTVQGSQADYPTGQEMVQVAQPQPQGRVMAVQTAAQVYIHGEPVRH